eukprot:COSAG01_NODE_1399_length_10465_cov_3.558267_5_plen_127_part_00
MAGPGVLAALAWLPGCLQQLLIALVVEWLMAMWPWSVVCSALLRQPTFASDGNALAPADVEAGSSAAANGEEGGLAQSSSVEQQVVTTAARETAAVQRLKAHGTAEQLGGSGGGGPPSVSILCGPF